MNAVDGVLCWGGRAGLESELRQGPDRPEVRTRAWQTPPDQVRRVQAAEIPIDCDHDHRWVGEIVHPELRGDNLWRTRPRGSRSGRRTTCATGESRSCISAPCRGRGSESSSGSAT
jgi:hypothetical protein